MSESKVRELLDLAKRNVREVKLGDEVMKLKDSVGNPINLGDLILLQNDAKMMLARVVEYHPGGLLVGTAYGKDVPQGQLPARLRILIDMTVALQPGVSTLAGAFRIANPEVGETIVKIDKPTEKPS
jgi:hypothetical protein